MGIANSQKQTSLQQLYPALSDTALQWKASLSEEDYQQQFSHYVGEIYGIARDMWQEHSERQRLFEDEQRGDGIDWER